MTGSDAFIFEQGLQQRSKTVLFWQLPVAPCWRLPVLITVNVRARTPCLAMRICAGGSLLKLWRCIRVPFAKKRRGRVF